MKKILKKVFEVIGLKNTEEGANILLREPGTNRFSVVSLTQEIGLCPSGWTEASWGYAGFRKGTIETIDCLPIRRGLQVEIELKSLSNHVVGEEKWVSLFDFSYDGGDEYYPCGGAWVNDAFFKSVTKPIATEKLLYPWRFEPKHNPRKRRYR